MRLKYWSHFIYHTSFSLSMIWYYKFWLSISSWHKLTCWLVYELLSLCRKHHLYHIWVCINLLKKSLNPITWYIDTLHRFSFIILQPMEKISSYRTCDRANIDNKLLIVNMRNYDVIKHWQNWLFCTFESVCQNFSNQLKLTIRLLKLKYNTKTSYFTIVVIMINL